MKKLTANQNGLGHVIVLLVAVIVVVVGFVGWRVMSSSDEDSSEQTTSDKNETDEPDISLQNIGLASLDSVLVSTNATREFKDKGLKGFYVFGDSLSGGRLNPNFEFSSLKDGTKVVSAIDGMVAFIKEQTEANDFEVFIQPKEGSMWTLGYDHIVNVAVQKDDSIKAGDVIGEPAMQNNGLTRFEIQINKDEEGKTTHYCPSVLLAESVKDKVLSALTAMQDDWEATTGLELYSLASQDPVGCLKKTMTTSEAEGN